MKIKPILTKSLCIWLVFTMLVFGTGASYFQANTCSDAYAAEFVIGGLIAKEVLEGLMFTLLTLVGITCVAYTADVYEDEIGRLKNACKDWLAEQGSNLMMKIDNIAYSGSNLAEELEASEADIIDFSSYKKKKNKNQGHKLYVAPSLVKRVYDDLKDDALNFKLQNSFEYGGAPIVKYNPYARDGAKSMDNYGGIVDNGSLFNPSTLPNGDDPLYYSYRRNFYAQTYGQKFYIAEHFLDDTGSLYDVYYRDGFGLDYYNSDKLFPNLWTYHLYSTEYSVSDFDYAPEQMSQAIRPSCYCVIDLNTANNLLSDKVKFTSQDRNDGSHDICSDFDSYYYDYKSNFIPANYHYVICDLEVTDINTILIRPINKFLRVESSSNMVFDDFTDTAFKDFGGYMMAREGNGQNRYYKYYFNEDYIQTFGGNGSNVYSPRSFFLDFESAKEYLLNGTKFLNSDVNVSTRYEPFAPWYNIARNSYDNSIDDLSDILGNSDMVDASILPVIADTANKSYIGLSNDYYYDKQYFPIPSSVPDNMPEQILSNVNSIDDYKLPCVDVSDVPLNEIEITDFPSVTPNVPVEPVIDPTIDPDDIPRYDPDNLPIVPSPSPYPDISVDIGDIPSVVPTPEPIVSDDPVITPPNTDNTAVNQTFKFDFSQYFPFCIPFDIYKIVKAFNVTPVAPYFEWEFKIESLNFSYVFVFDFSMFEYLAKILRVFEFLFFASGLMLITRKLIRG